MVLDTHGMSKISRNVEALDPQDNLVRHLGGFSEPPGKQGNLVTLTGGSLAAPKPGIGPST